MSSENIVKVNIGGTIFQTSKSTLTKFDGFFKTMLETGIPITKDDSGAIFIDRDPTHFHSILNFMRDGHLDLPTSSDDVKRIQKEAQYYLLSGLDELCQVKLVKNAPILNIHGQPLQFTKTPTKPLLTIHYEVDNSGKTICPEGFDVYDFLNRYKNKLTIQFDVFKGESVSSNPTNWHWNLRWKDKHTEHKMQTQTVAKDGDGGRSVVEKNLVPFLFRLENSIEIFSRICL